MFKFAFISRHEPTAEQHRLAAERGIELVPVGDRDAWQVNAAEFEGLERRGFDGVVSHHPWLVLVAQAAGLRVGVFEKQERLDESEAPEFNALHVW